MPELIKPDSIVGAETYPAEACVHLGMTPPGRGRSKRSQYGRSIQSEKIFRWAKNRNVVIDNLLKEMIQDGFGVDKSAEDPFDAMLGVMSMIEVSSGYRAPSSELTENERNIEGWILGQL